MSHYSDDPAMVRVDFFTDTGKWKYTEAVKWTGEWKSPSLIHDEFLKSLKDHLPDGRLRGLRAICLEPYHEHSHPISILIDW